MVFLAFDIDYFTTKSLSNTKLKELRTAFEEARKNGLKVVFRTAYGFYSTYEWNGKYTDPDNLEIVLDHIRQVSEIVNENSDLILVVQAGYIGAYGEWHTSSLLGDNESENTIVRNTVLKCLLDNLDACIKVNVRRPRFIRDAQSSGMDISRLGFHDDALLSSSSDVGTYDDKNYSREDELNWMDKNIPNGINGGEMSRLSPYSDIDNAVREFEKIHVTYLNIDYNVEVLNKWKKLRFDGQNAYDYMERHLGYRFFIESSSQPKQINEKGKFALKLTMKNNGFATIYDKYNVDIIVKDGDIIYSYPLKTVDLRNLDVDGVYKINARLNMPENFFNDSIRIGIRISDPNQALKDDVRYNVQLANEESIYEDGVNYFAQYVLSNGKYVLKYL